MLVTLQILVDTFCCRSFKLIKVKEMSKNIENLLELASLYISESEINKQKAHTERQEAQRFADLAIQNPQLEIKCKIQEQKHLAMAATWEQIAAKQRQSALICKHPIDEYRHVINDLQDLINRMKECQGIQCSNEACRKVLTLIETNCLESTFLYDLYLQCCGKWHRN